MSGDIGFVILSHREPAQVLRLVRTLNRLYGDPPIACHHDFSQSPLDTAAFPANVRFVRPSVRTGWAKWSVVRAMLAGLRLLYDHADPDFFVLLSGADYPIKSSAALRADLAALAPDALIDFRQSGDTEATARVRFGPRNPELMQFELPGNLALKWRHFEGAQLWFPILRFNDSGRRIRVGRRTVHLPFDAPFSPYGHDFPSFFGDHWFTASRGVARLLLNPTPRHLRLQRHLRRRAVPEEGYYQTVICNEPGLKLVRDNHRYAQWNGGGAHPQTLTEADLPALAASNAHFARKFAHDTPVLDRIDAELLG